MRVLVYQNPAAGHEPQQPSDLVTELQRAGHEASWLNAKEHKLDASVAANFDLVIAAGGDGNVGHTAEQLIATGVPIAVLPLGTANNMATILASGREDLADRIEGWRVGPFDAGTLNRNGTSTETFFEGVGIGAFADTAAMLTERDETQPPQPGREAELARDIDALRDRSLTQPAIPCEIVLDGRMMTSAALMLEVLNVGLVGPKLWLAPDADPGDGMLDVVIVDASQRDDLTRFLDGVAHGHARPRPPVQAVRARDVAFSPSSPATVHVDGQTLKIGAGERMEIRIRRHAVHFLYGRTS